MYSERVITNLAPTQHWVLASCDETLKFPGLVGTELTDSAGSSIMMQVPSVGVLCGTAPKILRTRI